MLEDIDKITVKNIETGKEIAVITDEKITTAAPEIVVILKPKYD